MATVRTRSGRVLTEKQIEELARRMEAGPNLGKARRRGRPSVESDRPSLQVQIRFPPTLYSALNKRATKEGKTVSNVVRDAVEEYLRI